MDEMPAALNRSRTFHARDGWYFRRESDGSVRVIAGDREQGPQQVVMLDADTWASVVASASAAGETAETFQRARAFHTEVPESTEG